MSQWYKNFNNLDNDDNYVNDIYNLILIDILKVIILSLGI